MYVGACHAHAYLAAEKVATVNADAIDTNEDFGFLDEGGKFYPHKDTWRYKATNGYGYVIESAVNISLGQQFADTFNRMAARSPRRPLKTVAMRTETSSIREYINSPNVKE